MKKEIFYEIEREKYKICILNSAVNTILGFLILHFVFSVFGVNSLINFIIAPIVFFLSMRTYMKRFNIGFIEDKNPQVKELLKTAKESQKEDNIVVQALFDELTKKVRLISFDNFISFKGMMARVGIILVLALVIVIVQPSDVRPGLDSFGDFFNSRDLDTGIDLIKSDNIFGEANLIELGDEKLQINIEPSNNEIDFRNIREPEKKEFTRNPFPTDAEAVADTPSSEKEPEDFDLIKEYNIRIREGT